MSHTLQKYTQPEIKFPDPTGHEIFLKMFPYPDPFHLVWFGPGKLWGLVSPAGL